MGGALILAAAKSNSGNELLLSDKIREKADALAEKTGGKVCGNVTVAAEADYIFLGVKPQMLKDTMGKLFRCSKKEPTVLFLFPCSRHSPAKGFVKTPAEIIRLSALCRTLPPQSAKE